MTNAKFDPLERDLMSPAELVTHFKIRKGAAVVEEIARFEPLEKIDDSLFFSEDDIPEAVLFISHRWQSTMDPDPNAEQFTAVKTFLTETFDPQVYPIKVCCHH